MTTLLNKIKQIDNSTSNEVENEDVGLFFSTILESINKAHILHISIIGEGSYAAHKALESYYIDMRSLVDELIETYQGTFEKIVIINKTEISLESPLEFLSYMKNYVKDNRDKVQVNESHIANIIDEIYSLICQTIYKVKFLR